MKAKVYALDGSVADEITLPHIFEETFRPDLIRKAVTAVRANRRQPYGVEATAGKKHPVESWGPGRGVSRVPRLTQGNRAAFMPGSVGGRSAHPPKPEKNWNKKINKKEMALARRSALAAAANADLVRQRGHRFDEEVALPVVLDDDFESLSKTKEVVEALEKIGVYADVERARQGKHVRAGKGKRRGRKYKVPKSMLIVASHPANLKKAARNLVGVDVIMPTEVNVEHLAPGGDAGRLTLFTRQALKAMKEET
ncbi:MAG TPA: 50S ribosomal protein L4 [Thermoplasmatales archaeon]|nr:50S ribosomal protein L4 [Thermoplasmatales archaeon]